MFITHAYLSMLVGDNLFNMKTKQNKIPYVDTQKLVVVNSFASEEFEKCVLNLEETKHL